MIRPNKIMNGNAKIATPYTRYTTSDWVGESTPTMREMDFSSSSHRVRVTSELVITIASNAADSTTRRMSLVRRVRGCSKLPETLTSCPSTCMFSTIPRIGSARLIQRLADNITGARAFVAQRWALRVCGRPLASDGFGDHRQEILAHVLAHVVEGGELDAGARRHDERQGETGLQFRDGPQMAFLGGCGRGVA